MRTQILLHKVVEFPGGQEEGLEVPSHQVRSEVFLVGPQGEVGPQGVGDILIVYYK